MSKDEDGELNRSKLMLLPSLITTVVLLAFVVLCGYFKYVLMKESGCSTIKDSVLIPFLGTIPFMFLMGIVGPCKSRPGPVSACQANGCLRGESMDVQLYMYCR